MRERKRHGGSLRGIPAKETRVPSFSFTAARRRVIPVSHVDFLKKKKKKREEKKKNKDRVPRFSTVLTRGKSHE